MTFHTCNQRPDPHRVELVIPGYHGESLLTFAVLSYDPETHKLPATSRHRTLAV